jgi:hypothetical protein
MVDLRLSSPRNVNFAFEKCEWTSVIHGLGSSFAQFLWRERRIFYVFFTRPAKKNANIENGIRSVRTSQQVMGDDGDGR